MLQEMKEFMQAAQERLQHRDERLPRRDERWREQTQARQRSSCDSCATNAADDGDKTTEEKKAPGVERDRGKRRGSKDGRSESGTSRLDT